MTISVIRVKRPAGFQISPRGVHFNYPQGDYRVPEEMPAEHAKRALDSGCAIEIRTKDTKPQTKNAKKPAGRKKKRSRAASGKRQR